MDVLRQKAEANKKKGWEYAYLLDEDEEEQKRGKTISYNLVPFDYEGQAFVLVDCPGHQIYVRSLIAGLNATSPAETIGCLVVSLAVGEYESGMGGGQTREDALLLRAVGITELVVVLNKVDLVDPETPRYKKIQFEMELYIKKLGFRTVKFHATSGYYGTGLVELLSLLKSMAPKPIGVTNLVEIEPTKKITIQARLIYDETVTLLFSVGLQFILHCGSVEYQVTVRKLKDSKATKTLPYALNGAVITIGVQCDQPFQVRVGSRVILRTGERTIGFGVVKG